MLLPCQSIHLNVHEELNFKAKEKSLLQRNNERRPTLSRMKPSEIETAKNVIPHEIIA